MRNLLFVSVIGLVVAAAQPAMGHTLTPCNPHLEELSRLRAEKTEMQKTALIRTQELWERKRDLALKEINQYIEEGAILNSRLHDVNDVLKESNLVVQIKDKEIEEEHEDLERQTIELMEFYRDVFLFDSTGPTRAFTRWVNYLVDLRDRHQDRQDWPPGYEEMPLLLEEIRAFQSR